VASASHSEAIGSNSACRSTTKLEWLTRGLGSTAGSADKDGYSLGPSSAANGIAGRLG
jgi:hypothetical protein